MFLLQTIPEAPKSMTGLLLGGIFVLAGVVVALALYIRHLHNKQFNIVMGNSEKIITVTTEVKNSLDNNTEALKDLRQSNDIQTKILESTKSRL